MTDTERAEVEAETIAKVVEWLRRETISHRWGIKDRLRSAWCGLLNPSIPFVAASYSTANALERGDWKA